MSWECRSSCGRRPGFATAELKEDLPVCPEISLEKGGRWVIFPKSSYQNHIRLEELNRRYAQILSGSPFNELRGEGKRLVVASGVSYAYALEALERFGAVKGTALAVWRVLRCNPFSRGGYDPVPEKKEK